MAVPQPGQPNQQPGATELDMTFREYHALVESTDRITERREAINTLFVSINALFLTGVGYLLLQFLKSRTSLLESALFVLGFLTIALITMRVNGRWHNISEQYRRLVNLRIRYMIQLENRLRTSEMFPSVSIELTKDEKRSDGVTSISGRGVYTIEDEALYSPKVVKSPPSVSKAEQQIARAFTFAYWTALVFAVVVLVVYDLLPIFLNGGHIILRLGGQ